MINKRIGYKHHIKPLLAHAHAQLNIFRKAIEHKTLCLLKHLAD
jgi:hypothetical protein